MPLLILCCVCLEGNRLRAMAQFLFLFISVKPVATLATKTLMMMMMLHRDRNPSVILSSNTRNNVAQHGFGIEKYVQNMLASHCLFTLIIILQPYQCLVSQIAFPQSTAINGVYECCIICTVIFVVCDDVDDDVDRGCCGKTNRK